MSERPNPTSPLALLKAMPHWLKVMLLLLVIASWLPLVLIARFRAVPAGEPRVQLFHDMARQPRYKAQAASEVFADGRSMRPPVIGTVARGKLEDDDHYYRGYSRRWNEPTKQWEVAYFPSLPSQVKVTDELMRRGQERYNIHCAVCHGWDGGGNGPVNQRAVELGESRWVPAKSLHDPAVRAREDGHLYNTIASGIRNMPGYAGQIDVADRWAIVAYIRALQLGQEAPANAAGLKK